MSHICTNKSFDTDMKIENFKCLYCCKTGTATIGYLGVRCHYCNNINGGDEWMGSLANWRRRKLGLTRAQIGKIINRSKNTIKGYEWNKCPTWYFDKTEELIVGEEIETKEENQ